jgi:diphosphomevalonate decarboxylase
MFFDSDFITAISNDKVTKGSFTFSAPSNIALVKYWGKIESNNQQQIPANPSLSFTLKNCKTITTLEFEPKEETKDVTFDLFFEGKPREDFKPKIAKFFQRIDSYCPFLKQFHLLIKTENTFPHSSGIASSASGMAALAINIMQLEKRINPSISDDYFYAKASFLARLGSGSACRSIKNSVVVWGKHTDFPESSDLYGTAFPDVIHSNFDNYQDTILLVDKGEKQVSSTVGHNLMHNHPFANERFQQAHKNISKLKEILKSGELISFIELVESEALTLHAMMMTSMPYFILMKPNTLEIINAIWNFRKDTNIEVCFTLDAGANVHVLYPEQHKQAVLQFIETELVGYCKNGEYICDALGFGIEQIKP